MTSVTLGTEARRQQVIATAATLFDRQGYHNTSMIDVGRAVGVAKPTLYHHFPKGKGEILYEIHDQFLGVLFHLHETRTATAPNPTERLQAMINDIVGVMNSHRNHVRVFFEHYRELPEEYRPIVREKGARYRGLLEDIISEGVESGDFREVDVPMMALAIFGMCNWVYQWYEEGGRLTPQQIADRFFGMAMHGLGDGQSLSDRHSSTAGNE